MYMIIVQFILASLAPAGSTDADFFDDFTDGDISDWTPVSLPGAWWGTPGYAHGYTNYNCSGLLAPVSYELDDCEVSIRGQAIHVLGLIARVDDNGTGIFAYVSPNYDVARIRCFGDGGTSTIYNSLSAPFPSGVWYELTFTAEGDQLELLIEVPQTGDSWVLQAIDPNPQAGKFGLCMGDEGNASWDWISASGGSGELFLSWMNTDDTVLGNGNMAFEAGEETDLYVELENPTEDDLTNLFGVLQSLSGDIQVTMNYVEFGDLQAGSSTWGNDAYGLYAPSGTPEDEVYPLQLTLFADGGYSSQITFDMPVGLGISSDVESGAGDWYWDLLESGWENNWHVSTQRNHTSGGSHSFKCGDTGSGDYDNHHYAYLATPLFNNPLNGEMTFWMWIDAQYITDGNDAEAYDGGLLQYGRCGTWIDLDPVGGYPYQIISGTTGPFDPGAGVFSGIYGWQQITVDIPDSLAGPGQIRFVFGTDDSGTREGWYIDDVNVTESTGVEGPQGPSTQDLTLSASPNPFRGSVTLHVTGAPEGPVSAEVFDLSGRLIASPEFAGTGSERTLLWDGRGNDGTEIPAGVYIVRLAGNDGLVRRLVRLD